MYIFINMGNIYVILYSIFIKICLLINIKLNKSLFTKLLILELL